MYWPLIIEWIARLVLIILIGLSVWSVTIIIDRRRYFRDMQQINMEDFLKKYQTLQNMQPLKVGNGFTARLLSALFSADEEEKVEHHFSTFMALEKRKMEKGLSVLGTLAPTSPFIGLLGTILGIIVSFAKLSTGGGGTNAVMLSLAEALILTAVGLIVAIPSVVAFNYFNRRLRLVQEEARMIKDRYLSLLE